VDQLIRELLTSGRYPTADELRLVIERIGTAPFNERELPVDVDLVGREYLGQRILTRAEANLVHLWKRVLVDEQWAYGTTLDEYLADLWASVLGGNAQVMIAVIRESPSAGVLAENLTPVARRGQTAGSLVFVGYSANGGIITTGYQTVDRTRIRLPRNARWLN
jgi:hypothetical protein